MRRGRWLFHPDPYVDQNPVFEVKKAGARVTAYLDRVEVQIFMLVGDSPADPNAKWEEWRLNEQELILTPLPSTQPVTQIVIPNAGWYRVEIDDLLGTQSMIWVEDEEGTRDDWVLPVHIVRPGCGGGGGDEPPPFPIEPQYVTCEKLHALINSGGIVHGQWYGITDIQPLIVKGQVVFVEGIDKDKVELRGAFYGPGLTRRGLWPCVITLGPPCQIIELIDTEKHNRIRDPNTIDQWPWFNPNHYYNDIAGTSLSLAPDCMLLANRAYGGSIRVSKGGNRLAGCIVESRGYLEIDALDTQINAVSVREDGIFRVGSFYEGQRYGIRVYNVLVGSGGSVVIRPGSLDMRNAFFNNITVHSRGQLYVQLTGTNTRNSFYVQNITVTDSSYLDIRDVFGNGYSAYFSGMNVSSRAYVRLQGAGYVEDFSARTRSQFTFYANAWATPNNALDAAQLGHISVEDNSYVRLEWVGPPQENEPPYFWAVNVSGGSYVYATGPYYRWNIQRVNVTSGATLDMFDASRQTASFVYATTISGGSRVRLNHFTKLGGDSIMYCRFDSGARVDLFNDTSLFYQVDVASGSRIYVQDARSLRFLQSSILSSGSVNINNTSGTNIRGLSIIGTGQFRLIDSLDVLQNCDFGAISLTGDGRFSVGSNVLSPGSWSFRAITVASASVHFQLYGPNNGSVDTCTFTAGLNTTIGLSSPTWISISGIFGEGNGGGSYNVTFATSYVGWRNNNY